MKGQDGYHVEYDYHIVRKESTDDGASIILDGVVVADFQAPDRMRLTGVSTSSAGNRSVVNEIDELWVGNVQYLRSPATGRWRTITFPDKYAQTVNEVIDVAPDSFSKLELAEPEAVDGQESYKLIGRVTELSGVYTELLRWDDRIREIRMEYYIGKDDYLIRKFFYETVSDDKAKSVNAEYSHSRFDSPVTIDIPEVAPPTPP